MGCSAASTDASDTSAALGDAQTATLHFKSDFTVETTGRIAVGTKVTVDYDTARTPCTGTFRGNPAFTVTGHTRMGAGPETTFVAAGHAPTGELDPTFVVPGVVFGAGAPSTDLQVWFESTSIWGCHAWDSNLGQNYHVDVVLPASAPDWMGNATVTLSRATCNGQACPEDAHALGQGFLYDSWAAQRAAIRQLAFEVYEPGVTDHDDPDLWKKLDVRMYTRIGDEGSFQASYVNLQGRSGNNARYAVDLTKLSPFPTNTQTTGCPSFPFTWVDSALLEADVQFYLQVNGVELRPEDGTVFHGRYQGYASIFPGCGTR